MLAHHLLLPNSRDKDDVVIKGVSVAFDLLTTGFARGLWTGRPDDWWRSGWALAALVVGDTVALVASGRR